MPEDFMLAIQIKAFALLAVVLLIVDAAAFHGEYRGMVGEKMAKFARAVSPAHWHGLGQGRNWSSPRRHS
jgi:hypothetical protein